MTPPRKPKPLKSSNPTRADLKAAKEAEEAQAEADAAAARAEAGAGESQVVTSADVGNASDVLGGTTGDGAAAGDNTGDTGHAGDANDEVEVVVIVEETAPEPAPAPPTHTLPPAGQCVFGGCGERPQGEGTVAFSDTAGTQLLEVAFSVCEGHKAGVKGELVQAANDIQGAAPKHTQIVLES